MSLHHSDLTQAFAGQSHPKPTSPAEDVIDKLKLHYHLKTRKKKKTQITRIFYGGRLGVFRAVRIDQEGSDLLNIIVQDEEGAQHQILAPVSQCSFMYSNSTAERNAPPEEKVILGFSTPKVA